MKAGSRRLAVRAVTVAWATACFFFCQPALALPQVLFYQGKIVTVISGQEPGGLGDLRLRAILPYLKKHIPGQPNIVPEYMPGGGGRKAANHIYRIAAATFITPPRTPPDRIRTLRDAITNAYNDPEFSKVYKKITGETPSPILPDEFDGIIKKLPRNAEDVDLYKKIAGTGPLPGH